jgi:hypothetical protein
MLDSPTPPSLPALELPGDAAQILIDAEFAAMLPDPLPEEQRLKTETLLTQGCREPLVVWARWPHLVLLTGFDVFPTVREHHLPFRILLKEFASHDAARFFVLKEHLAHCTLSPLAISYLRGLRYRGEKRPHGGDRKGGAAGLACGKTSEALAEIFCVSPATIQRDGQVGAAVEEIATNCGAKAKRRLLRRDAGLTRCALLALAALPAERQRSIMGSWLINGRWPRGWRSAGAVRPRTITLPDDPLAMGQALRRRRPAEYCLTLHDCLADHLPRGPDAEGGAER